MFVLWDLSNAYAKYVRVCQCSFHVDNLQVISFVNWPVVSHVKHVLSVFLSKHIPNYRHLISFCSVVVNVEHLLFSVC